MILCTFSGDIVGCNITHSWISTGSKISYLGRVRKYNKSKNVYTILYWLEGEDTIAEEYDLYARELIIDIIENELLIINNESDTDINLSTSDNVLDNSVVCSTSSRVRRPNPKYD